MVRIYGASDDLVEIDGSAYDNEIGCDSEDCRIWFEDGTIIHITYGKGLLGIWNIEIEKIGTAKFDLQICEDEDADIYSDIFEIDSEIVRHEVIENAAL